METDFQQRDPLVISLEFLLSFPRARLLGWVGLREGWGGLGSPKLLKDTKGLVSELWGIKCGDFSWLGIFSAESTRWADSAQASVSPQTPFHPPLSPQACRHWP